MYDIFCTCIYPHWRVFSGVVFGLRRTTGVSNQKTKSQVMRKAHRPQVAKKTILAVLFLSVALFNSLLPLPILSVVFKESATSCSMLEDWVSRFATKVFWSSDTSIMDFSAALSRE